MSVKKKIISMFFSLCFVVTFLIQSAHIYTHILSDYFKTEFIQHQSNEIDNQHTENCQICYFTFQPFSNLTACIYVFITLVEVSSLNTTYYTKFTANWFQVISLRGPPVYR